MRELIHQIEHNVIVDEQTNDMLSAHVFTEKSKEIGVNTQNVEMCCKMAPINVLSDNDDHQKTTNHELFDFDLSGHTGFPSIKLNGTKDDWMNLKRKTVA